MIPPVANSIHVSTSRPKLDLCGVAIQGDFEERDLTILLPNRSDDTSQLAFDIGGSLISSEIVGEVRWSRKMAFTFGTKKPKLPEKTYLSDSDSDDDAFDFSFLDFSEETFKAPSKLCDDPFLN
ncbi:unnamed protein product [Lactuca saligna]|uniref:Uncharacterized protein n=1 Tax=Lactuca saligna TaxID=75948 RepID=A0AA35YAZ2_LACSI|nr:unnamed protein product [Lactuca saligna]